MVLIDGQPLETSKRETHEFNTLEAAAKLLFKIGIAEFSAKLSTG